MKSAVRLMFILGLVVIAQSSSAYGDTVRNGATGAMGYSGSFVFDSTLAFSSADRLPANRDDSFMRQVIVDVPIAEAENAAHLELEQIEAVSQSTPAVDVQPDDILDLLCPECSSGERIAEAP